MRLITDRALSLIHKILETNDFAQALCGEFIKSEITVAVRRCLRAMFENWYVCPQTAVFVQGSLKPLYFRLVKDFRLIFATLLRKQHYNRPFSEYTVSSIAMSI